MFERRDTSTASAPKPGRRAAERTLTAFDSHQLLAPIFLVALAAAAYLGWRLRVELIVLFGAGLFGIALYKLSRWLTKRSGLPHGVSITIWFLAGIFVAVGFGIFAGRQLADQYGQLEQEIPAALEALENRLDGTPILGSLSPQIGNVRERMMADGRPNPGQSDSEQEQAEAQQMRIIQVTTRTLSLFVIWAMVSFYLAWGGRGYMNAFLLLFPPVHRDTGRNLADALCTALPWWLVGRVTSMVAISLLTSTGLFLLGVPLVLVLGVIAGLFSFVPILGPIASVVPAGLVALQSTPDKVVWVLALYAAVQFVETNLITPNVQQRMASVPPVLLISGQVILGVLAGIAGIMFSTPLVLALLITVQVVYVQRVLGEEIPTAADQAGPSASD